MIHWIQRLLVATTLSLGCGVALSQSAVLAGNVSIEKELRPYNAEEIGKAVQEVLNRYQAPPKPEGPKDPKAPNPCVASYGAKSCEDYLRTQGYMRVSALKTAGNPFGEKCATKADVDDALNRVANANGFYLGYDQNAKPKGIAASGSSEQNVKDKQDALGKATPGMDQIKKSDDLDAAIKADMDKEEAQSKQDKEKKSAR